MDSSDEEVLLFSLNLSSGANKKKKKKEKDVGCGKYLKKE